jgi:hypothetical protein
VPHTSRPLSDATTTAHVYVARSTTGRPLYCGSTSRIGARLAEHERRARWWSLVGSIEVRRYPNSSTARKAEADAIARLQPEYNRAGRPPAPPPRPTCPTCGGELTGTFRDVWEHQHDQTQP